MSGDQVIDHLTYSTYKYNRKKVSAELLLKAPEFTPAMEERYQQEIGRDAERDRLLPLFQGIFNAYRKSLADPNVNIPAALHFALAEAQHEVGEIRGLQLARNFADGVRADYAEMKIRRDQRERIEGRSDDFGASACGRSDRAGS